MASFTLMKVRSSVSKVIFDDYHDPQMEGKTMELDFETVRSKLKQQ